jgi:hypothetical protein
MVILRGSAVREMPARTIEVTVTNVASYPVPSDAPHRYFGFVWNEPNWGYCEKYVAAWLQRP